MRMKSLASFLAIAALCNCAGADTSTGTVCVDYAAPAITVIVLDGLSDQPIGVSATVIARAGAFADTARFAIGGRPHALAYERPGTYTVSVVATGYQPWQLSSVVVPHDACHVLTIPLAAYLARAG
jgi:hypothetical protein